MRIWRKLRTHASGIAGFAVSPIAALGAFAVLRASQPEFSRDVHIACALLYGILVRLTLQVVRKIIRQGAQRRPLEFYVVIGGFLTVFAGGPLFALVSILCGRR
jgi:hypothetical protein